MTATPPTSDLKCPYCANTITADYAHCPHCGANLATPVPPPPAIDYSRQPPPIGVAPGTKNQRPISVTVIGILLLVSAGMSVLSTTCVFLVPESLAIMEQSGIPIAIQIAISFTGILITAVSGYALLKGYGWGRWLYLIAGAIGWVYAIITNPNKLMTLPNLLVLIAAAIFLFRRDANEYFAPRSTSVF